MSDKTKYMAVEVVEIEGGHIESTIKLDPPTIQRQAAKVQRGININLNHDRYYTRLVEAP